MIQFMPANHSNTNRVIFIRIKRVLKLFSLRCYVALLRTWRRHCFHGINLKNWIFHSVSLLKYKRQMTGNKLCKPKHNLLPVIWRLYFNKLTKLNIPILIITDDFNKYIILTRHGALVLATADRFEWRHQRLPGNVSLTLKKNDRLLEGSRPRNIQSNCYF